MGGDMLGGWHAIREEGEELEKIREKGEKPEKIKEKGQKK